MTDVYSLAERCVACDSRAILTEGAARALADAADGGLIPYSCPDGRGWHVLNPAVERGKRTR